MLKVDTSYRYFIILLDKPRKVDVQYSVRLIAVINLRSSDKSHCYSLMLPPPTCQITSLTPKNTSRLIVHKTGFAKTESQTKLFLLQYLSNISLSMHTETNEKRLKSFPFQQHHQELGAHLVPNFSAMEVLNKSQVVKKSNWLEMLDLVGKPKVTKMILIEGNDTNVKMRETDPEHTTVESLGVHQWQTRHNKNRINISYYYYTDSYTCYPYTCSLHIPAYIYIYYIYVYMCVLYIFA